jgi:hypothetical protein
MAVHSQNNDLINEGNSHSFWLHAKLEGVINSFIKTKSTLHGLSQTLCEREWSHVTSVSEDLLQQ